MSDLAEQIQDVASSPKQHTVDGETVAEHPLRDLIDADQYLGEQAARRRRKLPIRIQQLKPPGAV